MNRLFFAAVILGSAITVAQDRPQSIIAIPACDEAVIPVLARAVLSPPPTPTPEILPPEYCAPEVCTARETLLAAQAFEARARAEFLRKQALDHALVACGY